MYSKEAKNQEKNHPQIKCPLDLRKHAKSVLAFLKKAMIFPERNKSSLIGESHGNEVT